MSDSPLKLAILRPSSSPSATPARPQSINKLRFLEPEDPDKIEVIETLPSEWNESTPGSSRRSARQSEEADSSTRDQATSDEAGQKPTSSGEPEDKAAEELLDPIRPLKYAYQYAVPPRRRHPSLIQSIKTLAKDINLEFAQDTRLINGRRFYRRMFMRKLDRKKPGSKKEQPDTQLSEEDVTSTSEMSDFDDLSFQMPQEIESDEEDVEFSFRKLEVDTRYKIDRPSVVIAENKTNPTDMLAIRIRTGLTGYSEWMNELQVHLLPNFKHKNIVPYIDGSVADLRSRLPIRTSHLVETGNKNEKCSEEQAKNRATPIRIEYWILNDFFHCRTLRSYLKENTLTWKEMLFIARGIMEGLNYLHENYEYQKLDKDLAMDGFIDSTNDAIKKIHFKENRQRIQMKPLPTLTIVHRDLTSLNIVLKEDLTPCIWNFGLSKVHHPFQPTNNVDFIDTGIKEMHMNSQYSAPELLEGQGHMSLMAMKSIDMYSSGIIFWELITRCVLPKLQDGSEEEQRIRSTPDEYKNPYDDQLGPELTPEKLRFAICKYKVRPKLKSAWMVGKKSNKFVQLIRDLWDHNYDARLQTLSVIGRLDQFSKSNKDSRFIHQFDLGVTFVEKEMWSELDNLQAPPFPDMYGPNKVVEEIIRVPVKKPTPQELFPDENDSSVEIEEFPDEHIKLNLLFEPEPPEPKSSKPRKHLDKGLRKSIERRIFSTRYNFLRRSVFEELNYHGQPDETGEQTEQKPTEELGVEINKSGQPTKLKKKRLSTTREEPELVKTSSKEKVFEDEPVPSTSRASQPTARRFILRRKVRKINNQN